MFRRTSALLRPPRRENLIRQRLPRHLSALRPSPSPVRVLTPELGDAATASCPCSRTLLTSFDPMSPVPPITTIFIIVSFILDRGIFEAIGLLHSLRQNCRPVCD